MKKTDLELLLEDYESELIKLRKEYKTNNRIEVAELIHYYEEQIEQLKEIL